MSKPRPCVAKHKITGQVLYADSLKDMDIMLGVRTGVGQSCIYNRMGKEKYSQRYNTTVDRTYVAKNWKCMYKEDWDKIKSFD